MFSVSPLRAARKPVLRCAQRRALSLHSFTEGFLDFATVLPLPDVLPTYTGAVILLTIVGRLTSTIPVALWVRKRQWRAEYIVQPAIQAEIPAIKKAVHEEMHRMGVTGTREALSKAFNKRANQMLRDRRNELLIEHRCRRTPTFVFSMVAQLPSFVGLTLFCQHLANLPDSPLQLEPFLTLPSLTHTDPTMTLPIVLGVLTMANVSTGHWFKSPEQLKAQKLKVETKTSSMNLDSTSLMNGGFAAASVLRILLAAMAPGTVLISWITSTTLALVQTWSFDWWRMRTRRTMQTQPTIIDVPPSRPTPRKGHE